MFAVEGQDGRIEHQHNRTKDGHAIPKPLQMPKTHEAMIQHAPQWSPYEDNGGTCAGIAGKGFVILAADTRLNGDFCFHTRRDDSKLFKLTNNTWLASGGMQADRLQLHEILKQRIQWYSYNHNGRVPSTKALSQLLSTILYGRRFFPLYTFNIVAGLNENGDGVCYSYDAVGCTEPLNYGTTGTGSSFIEPLMDCLIMRRNMVGKAPAEMTLEGALQMLKNGFTGVAERDINTGDYVRFIILTKERQWEEVLELRHD